MRAVPKSLSDASGPLPAPLRSATASTHVFSSGSQTRVIVIRLQRALRASRVSLVQLRRRAADFALLCVFVPVFVLAWATLLIVEARQAKLNAQEGDGE